MEQKNNIFKEMFNENNPLWLKAWKVMVTVMSCIYPLAAFIFTLISGAFVLGLLAILVSVIPAFINQSLGMLLANVIGNIQKTRECVELMAKEKGINTDNVNTNTNTTNANNDLPTL